MRIKLVKTGMIMAVLVIFLTPLARYLSCFQENDRMHDAAHVIEPMMRLYHDSASMRADVRVEPVKEIEEIWAIEDTRQEAERPLVIGMRNGEHVLGYDAPSQTFYCTIGLSFEDGMWPETEWFVQGADGDASVNAVFVDDYAYDYPDDAVAEGYRYELLAYTQDEYQYFGLVFTGLPIVTVNTEEEIGDEYIPACVSVSSAEEPAITSMAQVHLRGGGYDKGIDKHSYRVEFHEISEQGKDKKKDMPVLGMRSDSDWLLISNAGDESGIRNELGFDMWRKWNAGKDAFMLLESRMIEVFVQDEYMGMYQIMERVSEERELEKMGGSLSTDLTARMIGPRYHTGKPISTMSEPLGGCMELRRAPEWMNERDAFARFEDYVRLNLSNTDEGYLDDAAFAQLAVKSVNPYDIVSYFLFMNVCSLPMDNVKNNVYIWAMKGENGYVYTLSPWDMDWGFNPLFTDGTESLNLWMKLPVRMLDLNLAGSRELLWQIWQEKYDALLTEDAIYQWIMQKEEEINASGAYQRDRERWWGEAKQLDLGAICAHTISQTSVLERYMREMWPIDETM